MKRFAIIEPAAGRIEKPLLVEDHLDIVPVIETQDEIGEGQLLGAPEITIEEHRVIEHRPAVRALSGLVAIVGEKGEIIAIRDLGPELVQAADDARPYEAVKPEYDGDTEVLEGPVTTSTPELVRQVWTVRPKTKAELAAEANDRKEAALMQKYGERGLVVAFEQDNRLRLLEGKDRRTLDEFKAAEKKAL